MDVTHVPDTESVAAEQVAKQENQAVETDTLQCHTDNAATSIETGKAFNIQDLGVKSEPQDVQIEVEKMKPLQSEAVNVEKPSPALQITHIHSLAMSTKSPSTSTSPMTSSSLKHTTDEPTLSPPPKRQCYIAETTGSDADITDSNIAQAHDPHGSGLVVVKKNLVHSKRKQATPFKTLTPFVRHTVEVVKIQDKKSVQSGTTFVNQEDVAKNSEELVRKLLPECNVTMQPLVNPDTVSNTGSTPPLAKVGLRNIAPKPATTTPYSAASKPEHNTVYETSTEPEHIVPTPTTDDFHELAPKLIETLKKQLKYHKPGTQVKFQVKIPGKDLCNVIMRAPGANDNPDELYFKVEAISSGLKTEPHENQEPSKVELGSPGEATTSQIIVKPIKKEKYQVPIGYPAVTKYTPLNQTQKIALGDGKQLILHNHNPGETRADRIICQSNTRINRKGRKPKGKLEPESGLLIKDMCCLNYCSSVNTTLGTELFCFPTDKELLAKWLENCQTPSLSQITDSELTNVRLCSKHFTSSQLSPSWPMRLRPNAIPTLFSQGQYPLKHTLPGEETIYQSPLGARLRRPAEYGSGTCIYPGCKQIRHNYKLGSHRLPLCIHKVERWLDIIGVSMIADKTATNFRMCSEHFSPDQYNNTKDICLTGTAVPKYPPGRDPADVDPESWCTLICAYPGCQARRHDDVFMHRFPKDNEKARQWLAIIGRSWPEYGHITDYRICADHFHATDHHGFLTAELNRPAELKPDALPIIPVKMTIPSFTMNSGGTLAPLNNTAKSLGAETAMSIKSVIQGGNKEQSAAKCFILPGTVGRKILPKGISAFIPDNICIVNSSGVTKPGEESRHPLLRTDEGGLLPVVTKPAKRRSKSKRRISEINPEYIFNTEHSYRQKSSSNEDDVAVQGPAYRKMKLQFEAIKKELKKQVYQVNRKFASLKVKYNLQKKYFQNKESAKMPVQKLIKAIPEYIESPLSDLIINHVQRTRKEKGFKRPKAWPVAVDQFAMSVYKLSPRVYGLLCNIMELPNPRRLVLRLRKERLEQYRREEEAKANTQSQPVAASTDQSHPDPSTVDQSEETEIDWSKFTVMPPDSAGIAGIQLPNIDCTALAKKLSGIF